MEVRRPVSVSVSLDVDSDDAALLEDTVDTFLWSAQYVVDHAFQGEYVTTSKTTLDDETYDDVREATNGFNGGLVQAARNKAAEACKSVVARWKNGKKASKPRMTSPHVVYRRSRPSASGLDPEGEGRHSIYTTASASLGVNTVCRSR